MKSTCDEVHFESVLRPIGNRIRWCSFAGRHRAETPNGVEGFPVPQFKETS
jgi:hypothetical protein